MRIIEVTCSRSVKRNMQNYESTDVFVSMKADLEVPDVEEFTDEDLANLRRRVREVALDEVVHIVHSDPKHKDVSRAAIARRYGL